MPSNVYFVPLEPDSCPKCFSEAGRAALEAIVEGEHLELLPHIPVKTHFGEKGNRTYLPQESYAGILDYLQEHSIVSEYMETSVLYGGERFSREKHMKLAAAHGFDRLPVVIADGAKGEESKLVTVNLKHFRECAVAKALAEQDQVLVLAHFKGHGLAGFGGAIKQLSMGFAAKGGKLAMHMSVQPVIRNWFCKKCGLCRTRCQMGAIHIEEKRSWIDHDKCVGCGACFSICPHHAVSIWTWQGICNAFFRKNVFREKLVEYAYAASHGKKHIFVNFAANITPGCDCEPRPMRRAVPNLGVFASTDPVAVDTACFDAVAAAGRRFKGREQLDYAESIGLGTRDYKLITAG